MKRALSIAAILCIARGDAWAQTVVGRTQNTTDRTVAGRPANWRTRTIGTHLNYKDTVGAWHETAMSLAPDITTVAGYSIVRSATKGALEFYIADGSSAKNTGTVGIRHSSNHAYWIALRPWGVVNGTAPTFPDATVSRWANIWQSGGANTQASLYMTVGAGRLVKRVEVKGASSPTSYEFIVDMPATLTAGVAGDGSTAWIARTDNGQRVMEIPPAHAWDCTGGCDGNGPRPGNKRIGARYIGGTRDVSGTTYKTLTIEMDAADLAQPLTLPIWLDPTVEISGAGSCEDTYILNGDATQDHYNNGGVGQLNIGAEGPPRVYRALLRFEESEIPAGTITEARLSLWRWSDALSTDSSNLDVFIVTNANDWVEGDQTNNPCAGCADWIHTQHTSATWAGSEGCSTSGTDYDATLAGTVAYAAYTSGPDVEVVITLDGSGALDAIVAWRDATRDNNGVLVKSRGEAAGQWFYARATGYSGSTNPELQIDYCVPDCSGTCGGAAEPSGCGTCDDPCPRLGGVGFTRGRRR